MSKTFGNLNETLGPRFFLRANSKDNSYVLAVGVHTGSIAGGDQAAANAARASADAAKVSELNAVTSVTSSQVSEAAAEASEVAAAISAGDAAATVSSIQGIVAIASSAAAESGAQASASESFSDLAHEWADKAEDVEVITGEYSAYHWAQKAQATTNSYIHPNHSGDVTSLGDGHQTITDGVITPAKIADMPGNTLLGRVGATAGTPINITIASLGSLIAPSIPAATEAVLGVVEKATTAEGTGGISNKFPDAAVVQNMIAERSPLSATGGKLPLNKIADIPTARVLGNPISGASSSPIGLNRTQLTELVLRASTTVVGVVEKATTAQGQNSTPDKYPDCLVLGQVLNFKQASYQEILLKTANKFMSMDAYYQAAVANNLARNGSDQLIVDMDAMINCTHNLDAAAVLMFTNIQEGQSGRIELTISGGSLTYSSDCVTPGGQPLVLSANGSLDILRYEGIANGKVLVVLAQAGVA